MEGLQLVQVLDQVAKSSSAASIKIEHESRQVTQGWFIELFFEMTSQLERAVGEEIAKLLPNLLELLKGDRLLESHRQLSSHKTYGVVAAIKSEYLAHS